MTIDGETIFLIVGLIAVMLLLTGPGMWSEKWGWGALRRLSGKRKRD